MRDCIEQQLAELLEASGLPSDIMQHARHFATNGDLNRLLYKLPLSPDELIIAGEVVACAPSLQVSFASHRTLSAPAPILPDALCYRLQALVEEDSEYADAALYILGQNLKACAFNRVLSNRAASPPWQGPSSDAAPSHHTCQNAYPTHYANAVI